MKIAVKSILFGVILSTTSQVVNAGWLEDAWPQGKAAEHGNPAITFSADGTVTAVLPEASLNDATDAGLTLSDALSAFLGRYAPGTCSDLFKADQLHMDLRVMLKVQHEYRIGKVPFYAVDDIGQEFSIDYTPNVSVHCVDASNDSTSQWRHEFQDWRVTDEHTWRLHH